jgi:hypothetical protein
MRLRKRHQFTATGRTVLPTWELPQRLRREPKISRIGRERSRMVLRDREWAVMRLIPFTTSLLAGAVRMPTQRHAEFIIENLLRATTR